ncbi:hypothetical protein CMK11_13755 [Candidatus Poribacteria bacterium]|nr:hypothetical protein [Candidatus Poribacteria bacterium]
MSVLPADVVGQDSDLARAVMERDPRTRRQELVDHARDLFVAMLQRDDFEPRPGEFDSVPGVADGMLFGMLRRVLLRMLFGMFLGRRGVRRLLIARKGRGNRDQESRYTGGHSDRG